MTAPIVFSFTIKGNVIAHLELLRRVLTPLEIGKYLVTEVEPFLRERAVERFRAEGDDASNPWQQLTMASQAARASGAAAQRYLPEVGPSHPINVRTGELREYITHTEGRMTFQGSEEIGSALLTFPTYTRKPKLRTKLKAAQQGDTTHNTPARPVLAVGVKDLSFVMSSLEAYIRARVNI